MSVSAPFSDLAPSGEDGLLRKLSPQAKRALEEAAARRAATAALAQAEPAEVGGQTGPDPVRYGDWEKGGIAWDF